MEPQKVPQTGLLIRELSPRTYVFGAESGIKYKEVLSNGDWTPFVPLYEAQHREGYYDTMSCATFGALASLEHQGNYFLSKGLFTPEQIKLAEELGLIEDGKFNFNDWFTAVMSGTSIYGNDFESVWQAIRDHGVIGQKKGYQISDFENTENWLNRSRITTAHRELGLRSKELFTVMYEFIVRGVSNNEAIGYHLKHAPVEIAAPVCAGWNSGGVVATCPQYPQHATCANKKDTEAIHILDTYVPYQKKIANDYSIPWAVKGIMVIKGTEEKPQNPKPKYRFTRVLQRGSTGADVMELQKALAHFGFFKYPSFTQFFGYHTEEAVKAFQRAYASDILHPIGLKLPTGKFASMSIKKLNSLLA